MNKITVFNLLSALILSICLFSCIKKKDDAVPSAPSQYTINGILHTADTQIMVPTPPEATNYNPPIAPNGSYAVYTLKDTIEIDFPYKYFFLQFNIVAPGDTVTVIISIDSKVPIVAGTYNIKPGGTIPAGTMYVALAKYIQYDQNDSLTNSSTEATGTLVISTLDTAKKTIIANYDFTDQNMSGSKIYTVTDGQINTGYQEF